MKSGCAYLAHAYSIVAQITQTVLTTHLEIMKPACNRVIQVYFKNILYALAPLTYD